MSLFAHTRIRRRAAVAVLGAWVLGLLVGIANACALGGLDLSHPRGERRPTLAGHDHGTHASAGMDHVGGDDGSRPLKPVCQKFCDDEATTIVKHDKAFKVVPMAAAATAVVWWLPAPVALPMRARQGAAPPPEAPFTVRFMRLTI